MPPKKAKKAAEVEIDAAELSFQEKYQKALIEISSLQKELENKNEINARVRQHNQDLKTKINFLEDQLEMRAQDRLDLTSDMSRQYKTMQSELISQLNCLESANSELSTKLLQMQSSYSESKRFFENELQIKEATIEEQNLKMTYMTSSFEDMLSETLNKITKKLEDASQRWKEDDQIHLSEGNIKRLEDFQLTRLALGKLQ